MNFFFLLFIFVASVFKDVSASDNFRGLHSSSHLWWGARTPLFPRFLESPQNISALADDSAFLPCNVEHLADRTVTWMRKRDLHILTADVFTFSADERFKVFHPENSNEWTLQIKYVTTKDAGTYECQVNSDPKISKTIFLKVKEFSQLDDPEMLSDNSEKVVSRQKKVAETFNFPNDETLRNLNEVKRNKKENFKEENKKIKKKRNKKGHKRRKRRMETSVEIEGPSALHIQEGSTLSLTCIVRHTSPRPPDHLHWYKQELLLDYNSPRGGISVQTEKERRKTVSKLSVSSVTPNDSGEYSCRPMGLLPFPVTVHVQQGQKDAPLRDMSMNNGHRTQTQASIVVIVLLLLTHFVESIPLKV